ncbi:MAG: sulfurtransferase [Thermoanaerobaculia bacterium]
MPDRLPLRRHFAAAALALAFAGAVAVDASPRRSLVVTGDWLARHLDDPDLVLFHVGDRAQYDAGHIPGARHLSLREISVGHGEEGALSLEMPPAGELHDRLEALGISDRSRIVVYFGKDWISPTTRALFTFDYAGLGDRVSLLDGGQPLWVAEGRPLSTELPPARPGHLRPLRLRPTIVDGDFVRSHLDADGFAIVDARVPEYYDGRETGGGPDHPHRTGHIVGAGNFPFDSIVDDSMRLRSDADLAAGLARAGVTKRDTVITYCHIGQQATAALFAARLLGHPVRLYDGSFEDWSRRSDAPVEGPPAAPATDPVP